MAKKQMKEKSGALFKNKDKKSGDNKPNLTGIALIDGVEYRIAAWKNVPQSGGEVYFSLAFQDNSEYAKKSSKSSKAEKDDDDDFMLW